MFNVLDSFNVSAFIRTVRRVEILVGGMSDNFGFLLLLSFTGIVMVAFDMEPEVTSSIDHFIISLFVLLKFFEVCDVGSDGAESESCDQVGNVSYTDGDSSVHDEVRLDDHDTYASSETSDKGKCGDNDCDVV